MKEQETIVLSGHISPADREANPFLMLPFDVSEDMVELRVAYAYTGQGSHEPHAPPGNLLDIGILDPQGTRFPSERGFRGWSGTARESFTLSADRATPGYLPGPIPRGRWHIMLGAYKLTPEGTDYEVAVQLFRGSPRPDLPPVSVPARTLREGPAWFCGDLHCHTHHSDGKGTVADLIARARSKDLDFVALTEHNTISHLREIAAFDGGDFLLIPGQEVTTYRGHLNVWGCERWLDFRAQTDDDIRWVIDQAHRCGALASINHPKYDGPDWTFGTDVGADCVEAWQAPWFVSNYESLAVWEAMLATGRQVVGVGGSDCHLAPSPEEQGLPYLAQPTTWVWAEELSIPGILDGIRSGHVYVSSGPEGPHLRFHARADRQEAMMGDVLSVEPGEPVTLSAEVTGGEEMWLRLMAGDGQVARWEVDSGDFAAEWTLTAERDAWYRLDLIYPLEPEEENEPAAVIAEALTNAIYLRVANG